MRLSVFLAAVSVPVFAFAGHFNDVKITIRLIDPDSVTMTVEADHDDFLNTIYIFPDNKDTATMRVYQKRIEGYLIARLPMKVDGNTVPLRVVQWKPGGKGPQDGFDSTSLYEPNQTFTLGGRLPKQRKELTLRPEMWIEFDHETLAEVALLWKETALDRSWVHMEKVLKYPISRDSLKAMMARSGKVPPAGAPITHHDNEDFDQ